MRFLRYAAIVALTVWVGGLITLGAIVAPTAFAVVAARHVDGGRLLVGILFAAFLHRFHAVAIGAGIVVLLSLVARRLIGPRPVRFGVRTTLAAVMLAATLFSGLVLLGQVERIQESVGVPSETLPPQDASRVRFNRLHNLSVGLFAFEIVGGLALLGWETRDS
jgi:hypothetical protein